MYKAITKTKSFEDLGSILEINRAIEKIYFARRIQIDWNKWKSPSILHVVE